MKHISHPFRADPSVSKQRLDEVKYSGKHSSFPLSFRKCSKPLLVLLQDVFLKESSSLSIATRASSSVRDEEVKGGQNRGQTTTSLKGQSCAAAEPGKYSKVMIVIGPT